MNQTPPPPVAVPAESGKIILGCLLGVALVGVFDYLTGVEARVFPLYYIPIGIGALRVSRSFGLLLSVASTALWALAIYLGGASWSREIFLFNTLTQVASFAVVAFLVASIKQRYEMERDLSRKDNLTGLANSRAFYEFAGHDLSLARRSGKPFTIAYMDLDNFKMVNDQFGHLVGDRALHTAADVLRHHTRASDLPARFGGDEFVLLLPETGPEQARVMLERLAAALGTAMAERNWPITASVGAVCFLHTPATIEEAISAADALMYRVKQSGKNQMLLEVVRHPDATDDEVVDTGG